jgi:ABC-type multidrug transport system fused ATPase/permease subunit
MSRVERILHYCKLPSEAPLFAQDNTPRSSVHVSAGQTAASRGGEVACDNSQLIVPPPDWPSAGALEFRDVVMAYREGLEPVLKGVSFQVRPGQRVGIVGR